ncbi:metalloprotease [Armillaria luteobubalina]|uniref:Extracellular metalloproteinase n=1 Tax=Armillaria luteobubalina TaxID=153913 RepID=A0AA39PXU1_9AGAR|nr:metalloprotease [Armillaria luteobubalina]
MRALGKQLLSSVVLAVLLANVSLATPWPMTSKHSTHRRRTIGRDLTVDTYHPESTFKTYGGGKDIASFVNSDLQTSEISFIVSELCLDSSAVVYNSGHTAENDMSYAYVKQYHDGVPLPTLLSRTAKLFRSGPPSIASSQPTIELDSIISKVEDAFTAAYSGINSLEYFALADGSVALAHVVQVLNSGANKGYEAFFDAHSGDIIAVTDFSAQATGIRRGRRANPDQPEDLTSSPQGWVQNGVTAGNNVISYKRLLAATTVQSSPNMFNYPYSTVLDPLLGGNVDAARTNTFYIINKIHDYMYKYGWTAVAYNFQQNNFGNGGLSNDRVQMSVQDPGDVNNAEFLTLPEWTEQKSATVSDYILGVWAANNPAGIRRYPYSTNPNVNPLRYSSLAQLGEVHDIGEVWANMLHNVYAALVQTYGWSSRAMDDATGREGIVYLHLFTDALSLQPCNPTFVQARDAWIQADANRYNGANACILWNAFASRGLGILAANYVDDATVPAGC